MEPYGTPQVTILTLKERPGKLTYCLMFSKNNFSQLLASPRKQGEYFLVLDKSSTNIIIVIGVFPDHIS